MLSKVNYSAFAHIKIIMSIIAKKTSKSEKPEN